MTCTKTQRKTLNNTQVANVLTSNSSTNLQAGCVTHYQLL